MTMWQIEKVRASNEKPSPLFDHNAFGARKFNGHAVYIILPIFSEVYLLVSPVSAPFYVVGAGQIFPLRWFPSLPGHVP